MCGLKRRPDLHQDGDHLVTRESLLVEGVFEVTALHVLRDQCKHGTVLNHAENIENRRIVKRSKHSAFTLQTS
jgi:hypothetical protein